MAGHVNNHVSNKTEMYVFLFHVKEFGQGVKPGACLGVLWSVGKQPAHLSARLSLVCGFCSHCHIRIQEACWISSSCSFSCQELKEGEKGRREN